MRTTPMHHDRPRFRRLLPLVSAALLGLGGCGLGIFDMPESGKRGADGGGPEAPSLSITSTVLPAVEPGQTYPPTQLQAQGARASVQWTVVGGELPTGIDLSPGGVLSGMTEERGSFPFRVLATDGIVADSRELDLLVGVFEVKAAGLRFGDAWTGQPLELTALGCSGPVRFEVVENESGGTLSGVDAAAGRASYTPGTLPGAEYDRIRAYDDEADRHVDLLLHVAPDPAVGFVAEFGQTEVWYVNFDALSGGHGYSCDLDAALVRVGLRSPESRDRTGYLHDQLASFLVRRAALSWLGHYYGRNEDGTRGTGLPISFPLDRPGAGYVTANPGGWIGGAPNTYSTIGVNDGSAAGVMGAAYIDSALNEVAEHDANAPGLAQLGVFVNQMVAGFNSFYGNNDLPKSPVRESDVPALRALVYGLPYWGPRYELLARMTDAFGATIALILAHEIGHSLGLAHTALSDDVSVMNASLFMYPGASYRFLDEDWARLQVALPGAGRTGFAKLSSTAPGDPQAAHMPEGGVTVCTLRVEGDAHDCCGCSHGE